MRTFSLAVAASMVMLGTTAFADVAPKEEFKEQIPVAEPVPVEVAPECGWGFRVSGGVPIYFFDEQDTKATGGVYFDAFPCELPINLRIGAEVRHMSLTEDKAQVYAESPGREPDITYVRIPMEVSWYTEIMEQTNLYLGLGPDIVNSANDVGDTTVGLHLGGRLQYQFENNISVALDAGYMWATVDGGKGDVKLDGAYLIPTVGYRF